MRSAAFLIAAVLALRAGAGQAQEISNKVLLEAFDKVAFGAEYQTRKNPRVIKWTKPVNVAIIGKGYPPLFENLVTAQLRDIAHETGMTMRLVYSETMRREKRLPPNVSKIPINLLLFYAPKKDLPALVEKRTNGAFKAAGVARMVQLGFCHSRIQTAQSGALRFAYVAVPAEMATRVDYGKVKVNPVLFLRACVVEELTQIMGLPNDVDNLNFTIFSDKSPAVDLTAADRWMLRVLYDRRLTAGMPRAEALPIARQILEADRPGR